MKTKTMAATLLLVTLAGQLAEGQSWQPSVVSTTTQTTQVVTTYPPQPPICHPAPYPAVVPVAQPVPVAVPVAVPVLYYAATRCVTPGGGWVFMAPGVVMPVGSPCTAFMFGRPFPGIAQ